MYGYIYKCTYLKNNKIYIGQKTGNKIYENYYGSGSAWKNQVLKNCIPSIDIKREILEICETSSELNEKEKYWIKFYNSTNPNIGYNIMKGSGPYNQQYRENMSKTISNIMETRDTKEKISNTLKKYREETPFSNEHKKKLSKKAKGNKNGINNKSHSIKIFCILNTGKKYYFNSIKEAGIWWHKQFNPFKHYSVCVYQRKIQASIEGKKLFYYNEHHKKEYITNIQWYKDINIGGDKNDSQS